MPLEDPRLPLLSELERKILWLSTWTIHHANHVRTSGDGLKVGGHQASSASLSTIMTALYLAVLRPQDRVAVKPHASPVFHAIQYLFGRQTREKLEGFRGYKGAQSYPSRTKDTDDVDFSTGSVGLGVAQTLFASLVQDYVRAHGWASGRPDGRMIALVGDAEMDEGNIFEALLEGWKHGPAQHLVDHRLQPPEPRRGGARGAVHPFRGAVAAFGWDVVVIKHGLLQDEAFAEPGGESLREWIDTCPNQLYSALTFQGGAAWRRASWTRSATRVEVSALIERRSDDELAALMGNLGGHDLPNLVRAFESIDHDRPVVLHRLHDQGLRPAARRPQGQPCGPPDADPARDLPHRHERAAGPRMGPVRGLCPARRTRIAVSSTPSRSCRAASVGSRRRRFPCPTPSRCPTSRRCPPSRASA